MSASTRKQHQNTLTALGADREITRELDQLEKAANEHMRETLPRFLYKGEVIKTLLDDLVAVTARNDWRPPLERAADNMRRASNHLRKAVRLMVSAANNSPTYSTIPPIIWGSTAEAQTERQEIAALPAGDRLFGKGGAIESLIERKQRKVIDLSKVAPHFLSAMLVYATQCDSEAERIERILKARDRRYDRLGPMLKFISDVNQVTGKPHDAAVPRLLTDVHETAKSNRQFSPEVIRKLRKRHLAS